MKIWLKIFLVFFTLFTVMKADGQAILGPQSVCVGQCYTYRFSEPTQPGSNISWQVIDVSGSPISFTLIDGGAEIEVCFQVSGEYIISIGDGDIRYTVFAGNFTEVSLEIVSPLACAAQEVFDCFEVCNGSEVTFAIADIEPESTQWFISGEAEIVEESASQITLLFDGLPGTIFISFSGNIGEDCFFESSACVNIFERPIASFTSMPAAQNDTIQICRGQTVELINTSDAPFVSWSGGSQGSGQGSVYRTSFNDSGQFRLWQQVSSGCACADEKEITVIVLPEEAPQINCLSSVCQGDTSLYTSDMGCEPYNWLIEGNGTIVEGGGSDDDFVTVVWNGGSEGVVQMSHACSAGCPLPAREVVYILGEDTQISGPENICQGVAYQYGVDAFDGALIVWGTSDFGTIVSGQNTPQVTVYFPFFLAEPFITVSIENCTKGCSEEDTLRLIPSSPFNIAGPSSLCLGEEVVFGAFSGPGTVAATWQVTDRFGNIVANQSTPSTTFSFVPPGADTYFVSGEPAGLNFCNDSDQATVIVQGSLPVVDTIIGPTLICPGVLYAYEVRYSGGPDLSIEWRVDNGQEIKTYFGEQIQVEWTNASVQNLRVHIMDLTTGCENISEIFEVAPITEINWDAPSVVCNFTESIIEVDVALSDPISWMISPEDLGIVLENPSSNSARIKWQKPGTATLEASYCGFTLSQVVQINGDFTVDMFAPDFLCGSEQAIASTTEVYDRYEWYSDGQLVCTTPTCMLGGKQNMVVVYDAAGCRGVERFEMDIIEDPGLQISTLGPVTICNGDSLTIYLNRLLNPNYLYNWYFNGAQVAQDTDSLTVFSPGVYYVEAVHIASGCIFISNELTICDNCDPDIAIFTCPGGPGVPANFPGSCDISLGVLNPVATRELACNEYSFEITNNNVIESSIIWVINDGQVQSVLNEPSPRYVFQRGGKHIVFAIAKVEGAAGDTIDLCPQAIIVTVGSMPDFDVDVLCSADTVSFFEDIELISGVSVVGLNWDFGDPASGAENVSSDLNPQHLFTGAGTFDITLTIEDSEGCNVEITKPIIVPPSPDPNFEVSEPVCIDQFVTATASFTEGLFTWNFDHLGNPDRIDDRFNPAFFRYTAAGDYQIRLEVEDFKGCTAESVRNVTAQGFNEDIEIMTDKPFPLCEREEVTLSIDPNPNYTMEWSNGDIGNGTKISQSGIYEVTVTDNISGCTLLTSIEAIFIPAPEAEVIISSLDANATFSGDTLYVCEGNRTLVQATGTETDRSFLWNNGFTQRIIQYDGDVLPLLPSGLYTFSVVVTNTDNGCTATSEIRYVRVLPRPEIPTVSATPDNDPICSGTPTTLSITNINPGAQYLWTNGDTGNQTRTEAPGDYGVMITNEFGCTAMSEVIVVHPLPSVAFAPRGCFQACDEVEICLPLPEGYIFRSWNRDGVPIALPSDPVNIVIGESGTYEAVIANEFGCEASTQPVPIDIFGDSTGVSGIVFFDENNDGGFLSPDQLLSGMTIYLLQGGVLIDSTITDINGSYSFAELPSGDYLIIVDKGTITQNWVALNDTISITLESCEPDLISTPFIFIECVTETDTINIVACDGNIVEVAGLMITQDTVFTVTEVVDFCTFEDRYEISFEPLPDSTYLFSFNCKGEAVDFQGIKVRNDTIIYETLTALNDCDSVIVYRFVFSDEVMASSEQRICLGDTIMIDSLTIFSDTLVEVRRLGINGACDTLEQINILFQPIIEAELSSEPSCPGSDEGILLINIEDQLWPNILSFSINGLLYEPTGKIGGFSPGSYEVIVNDIFGCMYPFTVEVDEQDPLIVELDDQEIPCDSEGIKLSLLIVSGVDDSFQIEWFDGSTDTTVVVNQPGNYQVNVRNGCMELSLFASVSSGSGDADAQYYVPNTFTPNDDMVNDLFRPYFKEGTKIISYHFELFDRWGNRVFTSVDPASGWNGIYRNRLADQAVFVWKLVSTIEVCGVIEEIKDYGDVLLMKL